MISSMIRKAILVELKRRGWSRYRLVQALEGKMPPSTVYQYLAGYRDLSTRRASLILKALGFKLTPPKKRKRAKKS